MTTPPTKADRKRRPAGCPICDKPPQAPFRPFCSARCRKIDLGRWLSEDYAIPGPPEGHEDGEE